MSWVRTCRAIIKSIFFTFFIIWRIFISNNPFTMKCFLRNKFWISDLMALIGSLLLYQSTFLGFLLWKEDLLLKSWMYPNLYLLLCWLSLLSVTVSILLHQALPQPPCQEEVQFFLHNTSFSLIHESNYMPQVFNLNSFQIQEWIRMRISKQDIPKKGTAST